MVAALSALCERSETATSPATPIGRTNISAIRSAPETTDGAPGDWETSCDQIGRNWMKTAPAISPTSEPRPPTTTPTRSRIESAIGKVSGLTNVVAIANREPATPA